MVIIASKEGQLANRILHASSFMVNAREHHYKLVHPFFEDYYSLFSEKLNSGSLGIRFWCKRKNLVNYFLQQSLRFAIKVLLKLNISRLPFFELVKYEGYHQDLKPFDLNNAGFVKKAKSKIVFVYGWLFRDPANLEKHRQFISDTWTPNKLFSDNIDKYVARYKKNHDLMIGVHIRRGDYQRFEGGKWFYSAEQYYSKMKELAAQDVFSNKKIAFVICTNEKNINLSSEENFTVYKEERHFVEDLYLLSRCDYIIGPPSTFSIWASFFGKVPLYMMKDPGSPIAIDKFQIQY
jgi:hypothetical protein